MMRCFIAIDFSRGTTRALSAIRRELEESLHFHRGDLKWVRPEQMHLTLKFFAELNDQQVIDMCRIVTDCCGRHESFETAISHLGCFGSPARILWAGFDDPKMKIIDLQRDIENSLAAEDFETDDRRFEAHLTLARIKTRIAGKKISRAAEEYGNLKIASDSIDAVNIYKSELTSEGPIYTLLSSCKLK